MSAVIPGIGAHMGAFAGGASPAVLVYRASQTGGSAGATVTMTAVPIGAAESTRVVIVACGKYGSGTVHQTVTVGGIAATEIAWIKGAYIAVGLFAAVVPTGTTADVVISNAVNQYGAFAAGVWTAHGLTNGITPDSTATDTTNPLAPATMTKVTGGIFVGFAFVNTNTAPTYTGTGVAQDAQIDADETYTMWGYAFSADNLTGGSESMGLNLATADTVVQATFH